MRSLYGGTPGKTWPQSGAIPGQSWPQPSNNNDDEAYYTPDIHSRTVWRVEHGILASYVDNLFHNLPSISNVQFLTACTM